MGTRREKAITSKISVKSQTVIPREVRERLNITPGDRLRYVIDEQGVRLEKAAFIVGDDPFAAFSEWSSPEDEQAFGDL